MILVLNLVLGLNIIRSCNWRYRYLIVGSCVTEMCIAYAS
jgi:hypothetical protein